MNDNNKSSGSSGGIFWTLLAVAFIVLKVTHLIDWPWVWVLAPIWIPTGIVLAAIVVVCAGVIGLGVVESREDDELRRARLVPPQDPDLGGKVVRFCAEMECDARLCQPLHTPFRACSRDGQPRHAEKKPDHPPHPRRPPSP